MSADKHFNEHGLVPEVLDDHRPDDMPAARTIGVVLLLLLLICTGITAVIYTSVQKNDPVPIEQPVDGP